MLPWKPYFDKQFLDVSIFLFSMKNHNLLEVTFTFSDHFSAVLLIMVTVLVNINFVAFGKF